ncbi:MAG: histidine phosphatase family protein [Actinomycetota bacterium]|nr:histidine phosphatase family protein [Actinomycetota bacterium]MDQ2958546.1 histidine phosphatase family protein [Actinomycetota bacterium]
MQRRIVILRHGRTAWNAERRYQGQADPPLDEVGRAQVIEAAALVAAMRPDLLITSDLQRAHQTASQVSAQAGISMRVDERLRERNLGHWQGLTRDEVAQRYPEEFADWLAGRDVTRRGGESRKEVAERALELVDELPEVEVTVLVSHGATAMCLSAALLGLPQTPSILGPLANGHWTELRNGGTGWVLRAHNAGAPGLVIPLLAPEGEHSDAEA